MPPNRAPEGTTAVVLPVFNDWSAVRVLIPHLASVLRDRPEDIRLVIVDDGSTIPAPDLSEVVADTPFTVLILRLTRNIGHQRAIAVGLCHAVMDLAAARVVLMDADGEDRPEDVPRLLSALDGADGDHAIVVAERTRRSEGVTFVVLYKLYKLVFSLLTGTRVSFGNFSAMGAMAARRLINMHELLLNVPATVIRSRCPIHRVDTVRGRRYAGTSKMNLISLVVHGMSAIAVFSERTFTRILLFCICTFLLSGLSAVTAMIFKLLDMASPGWLTTILGIVMIVLVQSASVALGGLFVVLNNSRDVMTPPWRGAAALIDEIVTLDGRGRPGTPGGRRAMSESGA